MIRVSVMYPHTPGARRQRTFTPTDLSSASFGCSGSSVRGWRISSTLGPTALAYGARAGSEDIASPAGQELIRQLYEQYCDRTKTIHFATQPIED